MNITKMRFEQGYAVASTSGDIRLHPKDPVYLNCRASEAQASLRAQSCTAYRAYGTNPGLSVHGHFSVVVCALVRCVYVVALAWHTMHLEDYSKETASGLVIWSKPGTGKLELQLHLHVTFKA